MIIRLFLRVRILRLPPSVGVEPGLVAIAACIRAAISGEAAIDRGVSPLFAGLRGSAPA